jgi:amino acid transporter
MKQFFSSAYWLDMNPEELHISGSIVFLLLVLIFSGLIFLFNLAKKRKNNIYFKIWRRINNFSITNLVIAAMLWFFEYEGPYVLSSRLWLIFWILSMMIWIYFIFKDYKKIPERRKEIEREREYQKYIP